MEIMKRPDKLDYFKKILSDLDSHIDYMHDLENYADYLEKQLREERIKELSLLQQLHELLKKDEN